MLLDSNDKNTGGNFSTTVNLIWIMKELVGALVLILLQEVRTKNISTISKTFKVRSRNNRKRITENCSMFEDSGLDSFTYNWNIFAHHLVPATVASNSTNSCTIKTRPLFRSIIGFTYRAIIRTLFILHSTVFINELHLNGLQWLK